MFSQQILVLVWSDKDVFTYWAVSTLLIREVA